MKFLSGITVLAVLMAGAATPSFATLITPGQTVTTLTGPVFNNSDFTTLASIGSQPYSQGADAGQFGTSVGFWTHNPFGPNDLTFVYQVFVSAGDATRITASTFSGFNLDVSQSVYGASTNAAVSADLNSLGVVGFNFTPPVSNELGPGMETELLI